MTETLEFEQIFGDHQDFVKDTLLKFTMIIFVILLISLCQAKTNKCNFE